jgi:ribosomal protein L2
VGVAVPVETLPKRFVIEVLLVIVHTRYRVTYNPTLRAVAGPKDHPVGGGLGEDVESVHHATRRHRTSGQRPFAAE